MLEVDVRMTLDGTRMDVLLWTGDGSTDRFLGGLAGLGQRIVSRVKILPILVRTVARQHREDTMNRKVSLGTNFLHYRQHRLLLGRHLAIHSKELPLLLVQTLQKGVKNAKVSISHVFHIGAPSSPSHTRP